MCHSKTTRKSKTDIKKLCVDYKGGKCQCCGYNKCIAALDFHHLDPSEKDFSIAHKRGSSFTEEIKKELDKCVLICSNCHREEHVLLKDGKSLFNPKPYEIDWDNYVTIC